MRKVVFRVSVAVNDLRLREFVDRTVIARNTGAKVDSQTIEPPAATGSVFEVTFPYEVSAADAVRLLEGIAALQVTASVVQFDEFQSTLRDLEEKDMGAVALAPWETAEDVKEKLAKVKAKAGG